MTPPARAFTLHARIVSGPKFAIGSRSRDGGLETGASAFAHDGDDHRAPAGSIVDGPTRGPTGDTCQFVEGHVRLLQSRSHLGLDDIGHRSLVSPQGRLFDPSAGDDIGAGKDLPSLEVDVQDDGHEPVVTEHAALAEDPVAQIADDSVDIEPIASRHRLASHQTVVGEDDLVTVLAENHPIVGHAHAPGQRRMGNQVGVLAVDRDEPLGYRHRVQRL